MIKKILYSIIFVLFFSISSFSELIDCSNHSKLSKDYLKCQKDNLKIKSNKAGVTDRVNNFKSSKTLTEFFFKKNSN